MGIRNIDILTNPTKDTTMETELEELEWWDPIHFKWTKAMVSKTSNAMKAANGEPGEFFDTLRMYYRKPE